MCANNLPRVVTWSGAAGTRTCDLSVASSTSTSTSSTTPRIEAQTSLVRLRKVWDVVAAWRIPSGTVIKSCSLLVVAKNMRTQQSKVTRRGVTIATVSQWNIKKSRRWLRRSLSSIYSGELLYTAIRSARPAVAVSSLVFVISLLTVWMTVLLTRLISFLWFGFSVVHINQVTPRRVGWVRRNTILVFTILPSTQVYSAWASLCG